MKIIIRNIIRCNKRGDVIESKSVHNFRFCSCGSVAIEGGHDNLKRSGHPEDIEELSETLELDEE